MYWLSFSILFSMNFAKKKKNTPFKICNNQDWSERIIWRQSGERLCLGPILSKGISKRSLVFFFKTFFHVDHFQVFIEFVTILLLWFFWPQGMEDLSSLTRVWTHKPCIRRRSLNHWTTGEVSKEKFWYSSSQTRELSLKGKPGMVATW